MLARLVRRELATVVAALRSDAFARLQQMADFVALIEAAPGAIYDLLPPSLAELEEIVVRQPE